MYALPAPRGEISQLLLDRLPGGLEPLPAIAAAAPDDPLADDDLHLALYLAYELHYRGLPGVDERWEWEPSLVALTRRLEAHFEFALCEELGTPQAAPAASEADLALRAVADADDGPSLSTHLERDGTLGQMQEFLVHRSAYQLKEADPHSFLIPRLTGAPKAALVEIQADEYGVGRPERAHATLYADCLAAVGLDPGYGAYVDRVPGRTLATVNLMSLFGLHRRLRGACAGHLALFEMTSPVPNRRYGNALRRLGFGDTATAFFEEHVTADAVHEQVAAVDLAGGLIRTDPAAGPGVLWGARALAAMEGRWARCVLDAWHRERSSLRRPLSAPAAQAAPLPG